MPGSRAFARAYNPLRPLGHPFEVLNRDLQTIPNRHWKAPTPHPRPLSPRDKGDSRRPAPAAKRFGPSVASPLAIV